MKRKIMFMSLIIMFVMSSASENSAMSSMLNDPTNALIVVDSANIAEVPEEIALKPALPIIEVPDRIPVVTKFLPPTEKEKLTNPMKLLQLIGKGNINCYGGTAARYARG